MRIAELTAFVVRMPLRREFKHASAARRASDNLLVRCRLADSTEGWGEGVPRDYVTGETPHGALDQLAATPLDEQFEKQCESWGDVLQMCQRFQPAPRGEDPRGCYGNALRCAVELSVLDAFGRLFGEPMSVVTRHFPPAKNLQAEQTRVRYSTTIDASEPWAERISALKMRAYRFRQCKVKVGMAHVDDSQRLRRIRRWIGRGVDLRLDANEAWRAAELAGKLEPLMPFRISCVEQPTPHAEINALAELRRQLPLPIMLDESLTSQADAEAAIRLGLCDLFNIRLSKCGGYVNSLKLAALAHEAGLGYQLGCHPGESGVLSAAGRHWAVSVAGIRYLEGSYDRHLLKTLLTNEDVTFGFGGWAPALLSPGLGVTVNQAALKQLKIREEIRPVG